jgi:DNA-binding transcriptional ArsR family regulator
MSVQTDLTVELADLHVDRAGARCSTSDCRAILAAAEAANPLAADPELVARRAKVFRALGDPTRLRVLALLNVCDLCLCELVDALQAAESTLVHHLRVLEQGGLITVRREGKFTYFRANAVRWERYRPLDAEPPTRAAPNEANKPGEGRQ